MDFLYFSQNMPHHPQRQSPAPNPALAQSSQRIAPQTGINALDDIDGFMQQNMIYNTTFKAKLQNKLRCKTI